MLRRFVTRTPFIRLDPISEQTGFNVYVKDEGRQRTGSFKPRILAQFFRPLTRWWGRLWFALTVRVITTGTTGNQGQAVAWAVTRLRAKYPRLFGSLQARIFTTSDTPPVKENKMRALGAEVVKVEGDYEEARARAEAAGKHWAARYLTHGGAASVSSYGGSLGLEMVEDLVKQWKRQNLVMPFFSVDELLQLKVFAERRRVSREIHERLQILEQRLEPLADVAVLVPVGTGGLAAGVVVALKLLNPRVTVIGVASDRTASMYESLKAGRLTRITTSRGVKEDGSNVPEVERFAFEVLQRLADGMLIVPHDRIDRGVREHWLQGGI